MVCGLEYCVIDCNVWGKRRRKEEENILDEKKKKLKKIEKKNWRRTQEFRKVHTRIGTSHSYTRSSPNQDKIDHPFSIFLSK